MGRQCEPAGSDHLLLLVFGLGWTAADFALLSWAFLLLVSFPRHFFIKNKIFLINVGRPNRF